MILVTRSMKSWDAEQRALAKAMLGRPVRVLLAAWVLERGSIPFLQNDAAVDLAARGEAYSAVVQELKKFAAWGLLEMSPSPSGSQGPVLYSLNKEQPLWAVFQEARHVFGLGPDEE